MGGWPVFVKFKDFTIQRFLLLAFYVQNAIRGIINELYIHNGRLFIVGGE